MRIPREVLLLECFASRDTNRENINYIFLEYINGKGCAVATNGTYLGLLTWPCLEFKNIIINASLVKTILGGKKSTFYLENDKIIRDDNTSIIVLSDQGTFPDYKQLINNHHKGNLDNISIDLELVNNVSKYLKKAFAKQYVVWEFGRGELSPIKIKADCNDMTFTCLIMPCRL